MITNSGRGEHSELVHREISALLPRVVSGETRTLLSRLTEELDQPLRVAVTGRVNAGKSTLVNALLRQRIAPTDVSECTQYAAWFRFGTPERVEVVGPDGTRRAVTLRPDGRLPAALGDLNDHDVARIDVFLSNETLRNLTLIDTPGLASGRDDVQPTDQILALDRRTRTALAEADAMIFLVAGHVRVDDELMLEEFRNLTSKLAPSSINTLAIVSRTDQAVEVGGDALGAAAPRCAELAAELRSVVAQVLPVVGLLAETAECGVLTARDLNDLAALIHDREKFDRALLSVDRFIRADQLGGNERTRSQLLAALDLHGLAILAQHIESGSTTAGILIDDLRRHSGIDAVRFAVEHNLAEHADVVKASWALSGLQSLAFQVDVMDRDLLIDAAERIELAPTMHRIAEVAVLRQVAAQHPDLQRIDDGEVRRLVHGTCLTDRLGIESDASPDETLAVTREGSNRWRTIGNDAGSSPALQAVAATLARSYELAAAHIAAQLAHANQGDTPNV